jgi:hypothetical protein
MAEQRTPPPLDLTPTHPPPSPFLPQSAGAMRSFESRLASIADPVARGEAERERAAATDSTGRNRELKAAGGRAAARERVALWVTCHPGRTISQHKAAEWVTAVGGINAARDLAKAAEAAKAAPGGAGGAGEGGR